MDILETLAGILGLLFPVFLFFVFVFASRENKGPNHMIMERIEVSLQDLARSLGLAGAPCSYTRPP